MQVRVLSSVPLSKKPIAERTKIMAEGYEQADALPYSILDAVDEIAHEMYNDGTVDFDGAVEIIVEVSDEALG